MDKSDSQISATAFTLENSYGSYSAVFCENPLNIWNNLDGQYLPVSSDKNYQKYTNIAT